MLSEKDRSRLVAQETKAFLDDGFGQLDLSGCPSLQPLPNDQFESCDKKGFNNVVVSGSNPLKELANNPDPETIERIAQETGDPELKEKIAEEKEMQIATEFLRTHPSYYRCDENYDTLREYLAERQQAFTVDNLDAAFKTLSRAGQLEMKPGTPRHLTESEQLHVISLVKNGQIEDGISQYLDFSLPDAESDWEDMTAFLSDPNTVAVRNAACRFVWFHSRPVEDSHEFRQFEKEYFRLRPIRTVADYDNCYRAFEKYDRSLQRDRMIEGTQQTPDLDELNDTEVNSLTHAVLRQRAQEIIKARKRGR
jgi:hypothetical protein